jgi:hypothetical protein
MFEELIFQKLWIILPVWLVLYLSDYCLTILGARYYKAGGREHIVFEGSYELTPQFQADIDSLRMFSPRFMLAVFISSAIIVLLWFASRQSRNALLFFQFLCGGLVLHEVPILVRHARNILLFWFANKHRGISGQIRYERWLAYRLSAVELFSFAGVFLVVFLFTGSVSFLGGSILTANTGWRDLRMSRKTTKEGGASNVVQEKE